MRKGDIHIYKVLGSNLLLFRRMKNLSQEDVSLTIGTHQTYVSDIERGTGKPTLEMVAKLASALEVPIADLVTERAEAMEAWEHHFSRPSPTRRSPKARSEP